MIRVWLFAFIMGFSLLSQADNVEPREFDSPAQEQRYKALIQELRCLVCMNQNIADSNADLAKDLRRETYKMVRAGKSSEDIADFMVSRYGDFVLYRPPVNITTILLWVGPFILLALGITVAFVQVRRRAGSHGSDKLTVEEQEKLQSLLAAREENIDK